MVCGVVPPQTTRRLPIWLWNELQEFNTILVATSWEYIFKFWPQGAIAKVSTLFWVQRATWQCLEFVDHGTGYVSYYLGAKVSSMSPRPTAGNNNVNWKITNPVFQARPRNAHACMHRAVPNWRSWRLNCRTAVLPSVSWPRRALNIKTAFKGMVTTS